MPYYIGDLKRDATLENYPCEGTRRALVLHSDLDAGPGSWLYSPHTFWEPKVPG